MINLNQNKKRLIITAGVILLVGIWIVGAIIDQKEKKQPTTPSLPTPTIKPFIQPQAETITVSSVEVKNFYKDAILTGKDGYALFDKTADYKIAYIAVDQSFLISILNNPFEKVRTMAEAAFLEQLDITQDEACRLKVNISTTIRVDPAHAGTNYKLSFCE